jgi:hypothetical protein
LVSDLSGWPEKPSPLSILYKGAYRQEVKIAKNDKIPNYFKMYKKSYA